MVAVVNSAPEGTSFAEYARRGFFELCFVSAFNLFLLLFSRGFSRYTDGKENPFLKVLHGLLCVETLILIASALTKMGMYISRYGLTQLRFYTSWFMVTLIVVFVVLILSGFRPLQTAKILSITVIVSFLLLCWCNSDALIVRYNIGRWESGTLETLDLEDIDVYKRQGMQSLDFRDGDPIVADNLNVGIHRADQVVEIVGKAVIIINKKNHPSSPSCAISIARTTARALLIHS